VTADGAAHERGYGRNVMDVSDALVRIQDSDGRGPWRPGFSLLWIEANGPSLGKPVHEEFEDFTEIVKKAHREGKHIGCAVRKNKIDLWFTGHELQKLKSLGFQFVECLGCEILSESEMQAIVSHRLPLKYLPKVKP